MSTQTSELVRVADEELKRLALFVGVKAGVVAHGRACPHRLWWATWPRRQPVHQCTRL